MQLNVKAVLRTFRINGSIYRLQVRSVPIDKFYGAFHRLSKSIITIYQTFVTNHKSLTMKTFLLLREIYLEAFKSFGNYLVRNYFKAFAWFSFMLLIVVLYAFVFRVYTGFAFD